MTISIIKLTVAALIPPVATILFLLLKKHTRFARLAYMQQQVILGIVFGLVAILGTEWGIPLNNVMINCRDAAPVAAGLLFGAPAGIIAGIIGGVERWIAVAWGVGSFTRLACSLSTILSGFIAAGVRHFLLEDRRPTWIHGLTIGALAEVFHMTMVLITNISDATKAVLTIHTCFVPMVAGVSCSVFLCCLVASIFDNDFKFIHIKTKQDTPIYETIQRWMMVVMVISFVVTMGFVIMLQDNMAYNDAIKLINNALNETSQSILDESDKYMLDHAKLLTREITNGSYDLKRLAANYNFTEISIIDETGVIIESSNHNYVGFDMASGEQSREFLYLLGGKQDEYIQHYGPTTMDSSVYRKFAGIAFNQGSHRYIVQVSYDATTFHQKLLENIKTIATNRYVGKTGGIIIVDKTSGKLVSASKEFDYSFLKSTKVSIQDHDFSRLYTPKRVTFLDKEYYVCVREVEGYLVVALYAVEDSERRRDVSVYVSLFSMMIIFSMMFVLLYFLIRTVVVKRLLQVADSLSSISHGNLKEVVDVRTNLEFASLSDDINTTVDTLKRYIDEAEARIKAELVFAKTIQTSAMPTVFPERDDYEIHAFMRTAKEVGGDFYDFYMTSGDTLHFLIADVSGKGIPAAMFMMRAKAVLRSFTEQGYNVDDAFIEANNELCTGNDAGMFVTAWQGNMDLNTGEVSFANAGHNLPVIKHKDGKFEYHKQKINMVLAGIEDTHYDPNTVTLLPGDIIFLYTDGVTEATDADNNMFGEERLLDVLNSKDFTSTEEICNEMIKAIDEFVGSADQFDDITMLALRYDGR